MTQREQHLLAVAQGQPQLGAGLGGQHPGGGAGAGPRCEGAGCERARSRSGLTTAAPGRSARGTRPRGCAGPPGRRRPARPARAHHAGDRREHRGVDAALHDVAAGQRLGGPVAGGQRGGQPGHVHPRAGAEPQLLVAPRAVSAAGLPSATTRPWSTITTWSASASASSIRCVVSSTATPSRRSASTSSHTRRRPCGSSPAVGSSRNTSSGRPTIAQASASRCCWPPESRLYGVRAQPPQPEHVDQPGRVERVRRRTRRPAAASPRPARPGRPRRPGA